ncbi:MAG: hypothetical protein QX198_01830 [Methylococcaceae bacterium]
MARLIVIMKISKSVADKSSSELDSGKNKDEVDLDIESFDLGLSNEYTELPSEAEIAAKKVAARRKIELYWERKRLQEQLGDFNAEDFDF